MMPLISHMDTDNALTHVRVGILRTSVRPSVRPSVANVDVSWPCRSGLLRNWKVITRISTLGYSLLGASSPDFGCNLRGLADNLRLAEYDDE